jgi:hypothetical protein
LPKLLKQKEHQIKQRKQGEAKKNFGTQDDTSELENNKELFNKRKLYSIRW